MAKNRTKTKGIFCLEDDWWGTMKKPSSVEPILHLLNQWDPYYVPYIHRNTPTRAALTYYLKKWMQQEYKRYPILYLAFHGTPGCIHLGDGRSSESEVSLDWLEGELWGKCNGRIIYFDACSTLKINGNRLNSFLTNTGALAVCGYKGDVNWLRSTAFDLLVFAAMQDFALNVRGAEAMKRRIGRDACGLSDDLEFRMVIRKDGAKVRRR